MQNGQHQQCRNSNADSNAETESIGIAESTASALPSEWHQH
jgi:hypothetical protein